MKVQRRSIVFGSLFAIGLAVVAWQEYYPSSEMYAAMGMAGPRARSGRKCGHWLRQTIFGYLPRRGMICTGGNRWWDGGIDERVEMDGLTRKVQIARKSWSVDDSVAWVRQIDSIGQAFVQRGAYTVACPNETREVSGALSHLVQVEYWKFQNFYVRLIAYDWARSPNWNDTYARNDTYPRRRLSLQLDGYNTLPEWCTWPRRYFRP